jgi:sec-independent protein translocase protein TatC
MNKKLTLWEHLAELRKRIFYYFLGFISVFLVCSFFAKQIAEYVFIPYYKYLPDPNYKLAYTGIADVFIFYFKMVGVVSLFLSTPWLFWQVWLFVSPALRKNEKKLAIPFIMATSLLLMGGMIFAYYLVLPLTFRFFFELNKDYRNVVTLSSIWNFEFAMIIAVGLSFETPILIFILNYLRIVNIKFLAKNIRWAILLAFVISAVITPSGDPFTQTVVALPIVLLYLLGLLLCLAIPHSKREEKDEK